MTTNDEWIASMTTDQCFDQMATALGMGGDRGVEDVGYIAILEEVKKLKEEIKDLKERFITHEHLDKIEIIIKETGCDSLKELAEEHKKLKDQNTNLKLEDSIALEIRTEENECNKKNMFLFMDENKKLKENQLTEESAIDYVYNHTDQYDDWVEGSTSYLTLKEEHKKLKKYESMVHCVWSEVYWADKYNNDVNFKDIASSCDYYDQKEFIMKEVILDEEEGQFCRN